eukprot:42352-Prymnesium_polylepis.1
MAAEELAQATRRWRWWSSAAASKRRKTQGSTRRRPAQDAREAIASGLPICHFEGSLRRPSEASAWSHPKFVFRLQY